MEEHLLKEIQSHLNVRELFVCHLLKKYTLKIYKIGYKKRIFQKIKLFLTCYKQHKIT